MGGTVIIRTKDLKTIRLEFRKSEEVVSVSDSMEKLCAIGTVIHEKNDNRSKTLTVADCQCLITDDITRCYPFHHRPNFNILEDGWLAFQPEEEFSRLIHSSDSNWRISYVNKDFTVCRYNM